MANGWLLHKKDGVEIEIHEYTLGKLVKKTTLSARWKTESKWVFLVLLNKKTILILFTYNMVNNGTIFYCA